MGKHTAIHECLTPNITVTREKENFEFKKPSAVYTFSLLKYAEEKWNYLPFYF